MITKDDNLQYLSSSLEKRHTARFLAVNNVDAHLLKKTFGLCFFPFHSCNSSFLFLFFLPQT